MEVEHFHHRISTVEAAVSQIKTDVAVIESRFETVLPVIVKIGASVEAMNNTMQQQHGAMKGIRLVWACVGGMATIAAAVAAYIFRSAG